MRREQTSRNSAVTDCLIQVRIVYLEVACEIDFFDLIRSHDHMTSVNSE